MKHSSFNNYAASINAAIKEYTKNKQECFFNPISYILSLKAKRVRSSLFLFSCDLFNLKNKSLIYGALAIEFFHNFTLIHDDIMDSAPLRRGKKTLHKKWDVSTAILAGDTLMVEAYIMLNKLSKNRGFNDAFNLFNNTAILVCKGQQMDLNFERKKDITLENYLKMIKYKTAVLLGCSLKMAGCFSSSIKDMDLLYEVGINMGLAFQLQDDLLDVYSKKSGKKVGGDILLNKKTLPYFIARKEANKQQNKDLMSIYSSKKNTHKVAESLALFNLLDVKEKGEQLVALYFKKAFNSLEKITAPKSKKADLIEYINFLSSRSY